MLAALAEHGVEVIQPSAEMKDAKAAFVQADVAVIVENAKSKYGIADAEAKVATLQALIAKWDAIVNEVGPTNRDGLIARFKEEVYDKLPDSYGT